jgi:3-methyladenine DNA glycosylase AlkD
MIDNPDEVTSEQLDDWVHTFYSWDIVDQACLNLFDKVPLACENIFIWCDAEEEFVKRTAFSLIAVLAVHNKKADDSEFDKYFPLIKKASSDNRNFVKKSVNWALRSIGKRNFQCNRKAVDVAYDILKFDNKASKWVARDAIRELTSEKVQARLLNKS